MTDKLHRQRLPEEAAKRMLEKNIAACKALVKHVDNCQECQGGHNFCLAAKPLERDYIEARVRSRWYFGFDEEGRGIND